MTKITGRKFPEISLKVSGPPFARVRGPDVYLTGAPRKPHRPIVLVCKSAPPRVDSATIASELAKIRPDVAAFLWRALNLRGQLPPAQAPTNTPRQTRRASRKANPSMAPVPLAERTILTVKEAAARYPLSEAAIRALIFSAESHVKHPVPGLRSNGFDRCVVRPPGQRKVFIDAAKLEAWLASGVQGGQK